MDFETKTLDLKKIKLSYNKPSLDITRTVAPIEFP